MAELIGRLHPLVIHLPIGFLVLLGMFELLALSPRRKDLAAASGVIIALAIPAAIVSATCGWLLSWSGGYDDQLLGWHKWLGVSVAAATVILFFVRRTGRVKLYQLTLLVTLGLMTVASHFGGELTHGSDYLTAPLKKMLGGKPVSPTVATATNLPATGSAVVKVVSVYDQAIQPFFNDYCVSCHGEKKAKGKLRLDSVAGWDQGGESGASIMPNSAALSLLTKRLALPVDDEDHMPPDGKRQPSADETALLRWWIDSGASTNKTVAELNPPADVLKVIQSRVTVAR